MTRRTANALHIIASLGLAVFGVCANWIWAGLVGEYGSRGPGGAYLYDLSDSHTRLYVNLTGAAVAVAIFLLYWGIVILRRKLAHPQD